MAVGQDDDDMDEAGRSVRMTEGGCSAMPPSPPSLAGGRGRSAACAAPTAGEKGGLQPVPAPQSSFLAPRSSPLDTTPGASRRLAEMTWPEVATAVAAGATTVILPLGATEQHGPHLPLGTDTFRAMALAERLLALLPDALLAPALPIGCSDEHTGFAGLLSLNTDTLVNIIVDCARRMAAWGVQRLVLLSAHGGNTDALALAVERLHHEMPALRVWPSVPALQRDRDRIDAALLRIAHVDGIAPEAVGLHAGESETSEMLHLHPDLVRQAQMQPGYCGDMTTLMPRLRAAGLHPLTPTGVLGDPTAADAARGARYLDACAAAIAAMLERFF